MLDSATCCLHKVTFKYKDTDRQSKRKEENIPCRHKYQEIGMAVLVPNKVHIKIRDHLW